MLQSLLLVALVFVVYRPALSGGFIWDDDLYLTDNPLIAAVDGLRDFWFSTKAIDYYPLSSSVLWLEWRLWGVHAPPYHAVNVAIHALNALLVVALLRRLRVPGAWLAGAVFAVHPVAVEAAAWIAQMKSLLALLFSLASILAFLRAEEERRPGWFAAALVCFAASLLSKTSQVALPVVFLVLAWWRRGRIGAADVRRAAPFFALALAAGLVTIWFQSRHAIGTFDVHPEGFAARLAGAGWVTLFYLSKAVLPVHLVAVHPRWHVDPTQPLHWQPLAVAILLAAAAWFIRVDGRRPLFAAGAVFVLMLAPVLGFLDIGFMQYSLVADHWQYGALPAVLGPLAAGLMRLGRVRHVVDGRTVPIIAVCWLTAFAAMAHHRARVFSTQWHLWTDNIIKAPGVARGWSGLGAVLLVDGDREEARTALERALALDANDVNALMNLGVLRARAGDPTNAIALLQRAVSLTPEDLTARVNLGILLGNEGRHREAVEQFAAIVAVAPRFAGAAERLAWLLATSPDDAVRDPRRALDLMEGLLHDGGEPSLNTLDTTAIALAACGRYADAIAKAEAAIQLAASRGDTNSAARLRERLDIFRAGQPWRAPAKPGAP